MLRDAARCCLAPPLSIVASVSPLVLFSWLRFPVGGMTFMTDQELEAFVLSLERVEQHAPSLFGNCKSLAREEEEWMFVTTEDFS